MRTCNLICGILMFVVQSALEHLVIALVQFAFRSHSVRFSFAFRSLQVRTDRVFNLKTAVETGLCLNLSVETTKNAECRKGFALRSFVFSVVPEGNSTAEFRFKAKT